MAFKLFTLLVGPTLNMLETKDDVFCSKSDWSYGKLCPTSQEKAIRTCAVNMLIK